MRSAAAFTLLEMMIAVTLFTIGIVASSELLQKAELSTNDGEYTVLATYRAQECLETLRNLSYSQLGSVTPSSLNECSSSLSSLPSGSRTVTVTTPYTNLRSIAVTVSWSAPGGTTNVQLQMYQSGV